MQGSSPLDIKQKGLFTNLWLDMVLIGLVILIILSWVIPYAFTETLGDFICPDGTTLKNYAETVDDNVSSGQACVRDDQTVAKDFGAWLFLIPMTELALGTLSIVSLLLLRRRHIWRDFMDNNPLAKGIVIPGQLPTPPTHDLNDKLQQLDRALASGTINEAEYMQKRQEILDNL